MRESEGKRLGPLQYTLSVPLFATLIHPRSPFPAQLIVYWAVTATAYIHGLHYTRRCKRIVSQSGHKSILCMCYIRYGDFPTSIPTGISYAIATFYSLPGPVLFHAILLSSVPFCSTLHRAAPCGTACYQYPPLTHCLVMTICTL